MRSVNNMKRIIILSLLFTILCSCSVSDERIDAYKRATKKVKKATSSESLELIAYDLSKELYLIDADEVSLASIKALAKSGDEDAVEVVDAIAKAKSVFDEALSDKETVFYMQRLNDKAKK